jgi:iron complex outermembrane recepter protein
VDSDREDWGSLINLTYKGLKNNTITGGFEFRNGAVDAGDYYQTPNFANAYDSVLNAGKMRFLAAYIQDEFAFFNEKIILAAGLRYDMVRFYDGNYYNSSPWNNKVPELNENEWSELSPRLAFRFFPKSRLSTYISYSHGFRASILDDLCRTGWMWVGPKYANPELGPEYLDNYEIGMDIRINKDIELAPTIFYSRGKDFLYYIASGDSLFGRAVFQRQNVSEVEIRGVEIDLRARINKNLDFFANYTYNHAQISKFKERPELENKYLTYTPQNSLKSGVRFAWKFINSSFIMNYKDMQFSTDDNSQKIDSYISCDFKIYASIRKDYQLGISIFDLFDNQHMETADYFSPGRLFYVDMNIKIQ